jgi:hypothetical protein
MTSRLACAVLLVGILSAHAWADGMLVESSYAGLYKTAQETVACGTPGTYYEIPTWTVGRENACDGQTDGDIVISKAGSYFISASASFDGDSGEEYDYCLHINAVEMAMEAENTAKATNGLSVMATSIVTYCAAGYTLDMRVANNANGGNIILEKCTFSAFRIGP